MRSHVRMGAVAALCLLVAGAAVAVESSLSVASMFGDNMVLQRDMKSPIWGTAAPGMEVEVAVDGREVGDTTACEAGKWKLSMRPMKAGGPHTLTVTNGDQTITFNNVMFGDVWVASGQSNMQWPVSQSNNPEEEIAAANYPDLRLFYVERIVAGEPAESVKGAWTATTPETVPNFSAVAYFFGRDLHKETGVPVGLINTSWGGTPAESWTSMEALKATPELQPILERWDKILADYPEAQKTYEAQLKEWEAAAAKAKEEGKEEPKKPGAPMGPDHPHRAAGLFNGMIAPIAPYGIRGAIWYQGESNAGRAYQYRTLFPVMIESWREAWNQGPFPFYWVQLANFKARQPEPVESDWAELREAQDMTLALKNTDQAVIIDIGEADDIHPRNKQEVGRRLAQIAIDDDYGARIESFGPRFKSARFRDGKAVVTFKHVDEGLVAEGDALKGFAIAGADKKFVWANAKVIGKNKVEVWSEQVTDPVAVRYAWADNPDATLYNTKDLPAAPFRSDEWPGLTAEAK